MLYKGSMTVMSKPILEKDILTATFDIAVGVVEKLPAVALACGKGLAACGVAMEDASHSLANGAESIKEMFTSNSSGYEMAGPAIEKAPEAGLTVASLSEADLSDLNPNATNINSLDRVAAFMQQNQSAGVYHA